jgi:hypothetical protein
MGTHPQQCRALLCQHVATNSDTRVERVRTQRAERSALPPQEAHPAPVGAKQHVRRTPYQRPNARLQQGAGTHGARLEGDVQRSLAQSLPAAKCLCSGAYTKQLRVRSWVALETALAAQCAVSDSYAAFSHQSITPVVCSGNYLAAKLD